MGEIPFVYKALHKLFSRRTRVILVLYITYKIEYIFEVGSTINSQSTSPTVMFACGWFIVYAQIHNTR